MGIYYSWNTRLDRDWKPAGIYTTTPFPITEVSTSYSVKNDENPSGKTFTLGTLYFVDGARANDSGDGLSLAAAKKTIAAAITAASSGNKTIIVRGAHDAFDGTYTPLNISLSACSGAGDTTRFTVVGYGQERPILDGTGLGAYATCFGGNSFSYVTLQRLKITNYPDRGIIFTASSANLTGINIIDLWLYNNATDDLTDGNIHFYGTATYSSNNTWLHHCTSEHCVRKGVKISDHTHDTIIEWNVVKDCGWWDGQSVEPNRSANNYAIDCATDGVSTHNLRTIWRYNVVGAAFFGNELRYSEDFSIHHNEFYDSVKRDKWPLHAAGYDMTASLSIRYPIGGRVYSNIFRDNTDTIYPYLFTTVGGTAVSPTLFYNNLVYCDQNNAMASVYLYNWNGSGFVRNISMLNNSFYCRNSAGVPIVHISNDAPFSGETISFKNNIVWQKGAGACVDFGPENSPILLMSYNRYYFPSGTRGTTLGTGESDGTPGWVIAPSGDYSITMAALNANHAGADLSSVFTTDFLERTRSTWDMGAKDYIVESSPYVRVY